MWFNISNYWYQKSLHPLLILLLPFAWLFQLCVTIRRWCYQNGLFHVQQFSVPVIVVGNITVGGTGKTPLVIWLAQFLQAQGYRPGIVSRGVGGRKHFQPYQVQINSAVEEVGDEALLLAQGSGCPLVLCIDRVAAAQYLLTNTTCDIILSDDGLQHYRLGRCIEIAMVDGVRRFGNQQLLPAGPLRESTKRLQTVDYIVVNAGNQQDEYAMQLAPLEFVSVQNPEIKFSCERFPYKKIHAVAAIGHPQRFFSQLTELGLEVVPHVYTDHHLYRPEDIDFQPKMPIVMTEKDAVKCRAFCADDCWYLRVDVKMNDHFKDIILKMLSQKLEGQSHAAQ